MSKIDEFMGNLKRLFMVLLPIMVFTLVQCSDKQDSNEKELEQREAAPELDEALVELNRHIRRAPKDPEVHHNRAVYFMSQKQYELALVDMRTVFKLDTNNANYFYTAGELFMKIGAFDQADDVLLIATTKNPDLARAHVKRGELAFYNKLYNTAMKYINDGLKADVNYAEGYFWKGMVYLEQQNADKAISSFMTAIEQNPDYIEAYMQLGLLIQEVQPDMAWQYFSNVLKLDDQHEDAYYARAMLVQEGGFPDSALVDYAQILEINPNHFDATYNTGYVHLLEKRYDEAIEWFSKALQLDGRSYRAIHNRGLAYEMKGNLEVARSEYRAALKLEPGFDLALRALNRVN
ncbi:MAG: tetratricopeptide repeat protein [Bacteroidia bacterium]